jgi:hypothetical protein
MSAYSTISVTRSAAKKKLFEYIMGNISDKQLESFLDDVVRHRLYNVMIVNDDEKNEDFLLD